MATNLFIGCAKQCDRTIQLRLLCFFNRGKSNDNARFHIQCAGTKDFSILFAIGSLVDCSKREDGVHMAENEDSALTPSPSPSGRGRLEARKHMITSFLILNDFNLCTQFTCLFRDDRTDLVNSTFVV